MKTEWLIILVLFTHFVGDFILQTSKMATQKSKSNKWLGIHIAVYSLPLLLFGPLFALINAIAHFVTDYVTSRITSKLWAKGDVHNFFVVIGFDQFLHAAVLIATLPLIW